MDISRKPISGFFIASILISSLKANPSLTRFILERISRRNTHIPDCESLTQRRYRTDMARERMRFPTRCLRLIASGLTVGCLLYTSDAADERSSVDLGGR